MTYGSLKTRWTDGVNWTWVNEEFRARLPTNLDNTVMNLHSADRFHAKQGRSTARLLIHEAGQPLPVYLKRHFRLPFSIRLAAFLNPGGRHSPAAAEWTHLERVRKLGINVPDVVAAGERIGPRGRLQSFLMLAELTGSIALNELVPRLARELDRNAFATLKRRVINEMAAITATLHREHVFHKDLYLCHFFLDSQGDRTHSNGPKLTLIDLHRLKEHRITGDWWRWKDLAQLFFSTEGVAGINARDCLRFWARYCRLTGLAWPVLHARIIELRTARYRGHNRKQR